MPNQSTKTTLNSYESIITEYWNTFIKPIDNNINLEALNTLYETNKASLQQYRWGIGHAEHDFQYKGNTNNADKKISELFPAQIESANYKTIIWAFFLFTLYQQSTLLNDSIKNLLQAEIIKSLQIVMTFLKDSTNNNYDITKNIVAMLLSVELVQVHITERAEQSFTVGVHNTNTIPAVYIRKNIPYQAGCLLNWVTLNNEIFTDFITILTQLSSNNITQEMLFIALAGDQTRKAIGWSEEDATTLPQTPVEQLSKLMRITPEANHNSHLKHYAQYTPLEFFHCFIEPLTVNNNTYETLLEMLIGTYCNDKNSHPEEHQLIHFFKDSAPFYHLAGDYFVHIGLTPIKDDTINRDLHNRLSCLIHATSVSNPEMRNLLIDPNLGEHKSNKNAVVNYILSIQDVQTKLYYIDLALGKHDKKSLLFTFLKKARKYGIESTEKRKGSSLERLAIARRDLTGKAVVHEIRTVSKIFRSYNSPSARMSSKTLQDMLQNYSDTLNNSKKEEANDDATSQIRCWIGPQDKDISIARDSLDFPLFITESNSEKNAEHEPLNKCIIQTFHTLYQYQLEIIREKYQSNSNNTANSSTDANSNDSKNSNSSETLAQRIRKEMIEQMVHLMNMLKTQIESSKKSLPSDVLIILNILNIELINKDPEYGIDYFPAASLISWVTVNSDLFNAFIALSQALGRKNRTWEMFINALEGRQERNLLEKDETDLTQQMMTSEENIEFTLQMQTLYPLIAETPLGEIVEITITTDDRSSNEQLCKLYHAKALRCPAAGVDDLYKKIQRLPLQERLLFLEYLLFKKEDVSHSDTFINFLILNSAGHYIRHFAAEYLITQKLLNTTSTDLTLVASQIPNIAPAMRDLIFSQAPMGPDQLNQTQKDAMASWWNTFKKELREAIKKLPLLERIIALRHLLTEGTPLYVFFKHQRTWFPDFGLTSQFSIAQRDEANTRKLLAIWFFTQHEKDLKSTVQGILKNEAIRLIKKGNAKEDFAEHIFHLDDEEKEKYIAEAVKDNSTLNAIFTAPRGRIFPVTPTRGVFGQIHGLAKILGSGIYKNEADSSSTLSEVTQNQTSVEITTPSSNNT